MPLVFNRYLAAVASLLWLAGCSQVEENLKPVTLEPIDTEVRFRKVWIEPISRGQDARYERLEPVVANATVYLADTAGMVYAVDAETGKQLWRTDLDQDIGGGVGYADGTLYVGTLSGRAIALNAEDGSRLWTSVISSEIVSTPAADAEMVVTKAIDGRVFALNKDDGAVIWNYDHPVPVLTLRAQGSPVIAEQMVYIPFDNGQLVAFDRNLGVIRWNARIGQPTGKTEIERLVDVDTTPILDGPFIYTAGYQSRLVAVNRATGRITWGQEVSTYHEIAKGGGKIVVVDVDSHIKAFDAVTGTLAWENDKLHRREVSAPGIVGDRVVVTDFEGYLHALDLNSGEFVARNKTQTAKVFAQPMAVGENVLILDQKGMLRMYHITDAKPPTQKDHPSQRLRGTFRK